MSSLLEVVIVEQVFAVLFLLVGDDSSTIVVGKNVGVDLCLAIVVRVGGRVSGASAGWQGNKIKLAIATVLLRRKRSAVYNTRLDRKSVV